MKKQNWLKQALLLGMVFFLAAFIVKPVGVSTQFSVVSGIIHSTIRPDVIVEDDTSEFGYRSTNAYYDRDGGKLAMQIKHPINYGFVFVLAMPFGGFLGYFLRNKRNKSKDYEEDTCVLGTENGLEKKNTWRMYLTSFVGGFLILYGSRMADGCTSGHMMSGMMQSSVSGYLFAGAAFAVAIPTAIIIGNRLTRKGGR